MQIPPWGPLAEVFMLDSGWHQGSSLLGQSSGQLRVLSVIPSGEAGGLARPVASLRSVASARLPGDDFGWLRERNRPSPRPGRRAARLQQHRAASAPDPAPRHCQLACGAGLARVGRLGTSQWPAAFGAAVPAFSNHALLVVLAPAPLLGAVCKGVQQAPWLLVPTKRHSAGVVLPRAASKCSWTLGSCPSCWLCARRIPGWTRS